jgi:hypothetical protein
MPAEAGDVDRLQRARNFGTRNGVFGHVECVRPVSGEPRDKVDERPESLVATGACCVLGHQGKDAPRQNLAPSGEFADLLRVSTDNGAVNKT